MFAGIGLWLAKSALMTSPIGGALKLVGGFFKLIPWQVWLALGLVAAVYFGWRMHESRVKAFGEERYTSGFRTGYTAAEEDQKKAIRETDQKTAAIVADERGKNHEANARSNAVAADLLVRGPGAASARCPTVPAAASGHEPPAPAADVERPGLPPADREAVVPWGWLVSRALQCDLDRNEVIAWRTWHQRIEQAWPKPSASVTEK